MLAGQGERYAVLAEIVGGAHLAAEAVPPVADAHGARVVGKGMQQNRNVESAPAQHVGDSALISEIGERDQNAVYLISPAAKQFSAEASLVERFYGADIGRAGFHDHGPDLVLGQYRQDALTATGGQVMGEEASVAYDHCQGQWALER